MVVIVILLLIICGLVAYIVINRPKASVQQQAQNIIDQAKDTIEQSKESIEQKTKVYTINYTDVSDPGLVATITIDYDTKISVVKQTYCGSAPGCKEEDLRDTYTLDFDVAVKKNIVDKYIPKIFGSKQTVELSNIDESYADVQDFLNAVFEKDQTLIK